MTLKPGVRIAGIRPETVLGILAADQVYRDHDTDMVVTSVCEGKHSKGSLHYAGCAFDCRISNLAWQYLRGGAIGCGQRHPDPNTV